MRISGTDSMAARRDRLRMLPIAAAGCLFTAALLTACASSPDSMLTTVHGPGPWSGIDLGGIACTAADACTAVGQQIQGGLGRAIVIEQRAGRWGEQLPLGKHLSAGAQALVDVACSRTGDCVASSGADGAPLLVLSQVNGRWSSGHRVTGAGSLLTLAGTAAACSPRGMCWLLLSQLASAEEQGKVESQAVAYALGERDGHWLKPFRLGGPTFRVAGKPEGYLIAKEMSCWSPSSCTVGGIAIAGRRQTTFLQSETNGVWGPALQAPVAGASKSSFLASWFASPSFFCASPNTCIFGGSVNHVGAVEQVNDGRWQRPSLRVGITGHHASSQVWDVECQTVAFCVAAGTTALSPTTRVAPFAQMEIDGHWLTPLLMRRDGNMPISGGWISGVACPSASTCDVVGQFAVGQRWLSFQLQYEDGEWRDRVVSLGGSPGQTLLNQMSCASRMCWVTGDVETRNGTPTEGAIIPFTAAPAETG